MKVFIFFIISLFIISPVLAISQTSNNVTIIYYHSSAGYSDTNNGMNLSYGQGQVIIGNHTNESITASKGIFYINSSTGSIQGEEEEEEENNEGAAIPTSGPPHISGNETNETMQLKICEQYTPILQRLRDDCRIQNGICEDGEIPSLDADCAITKENIVCNGVRCIFKELWFFKLAMIALMILFLFYKKDYLPFIIILSLIIIMTFGTSLGISLPSISNETQSITPLLLDQDPITSEYMCPQQETFLARLRDDCKTENNICEDGEIPGKDSDCNLDKKSLFCSDARCIYKELWFIKLLMIILSAFIAFYKRDHLPFIIGILIFVIITFNVDLGINTPQIDDSGLQKTQILYSDTAINSSIILKYGSRVSPSNPPLGFAIGALALTVAGYMIFRASKNRISRKKRKK